MKKFQTITFFILAITLLTSACSTSKTKSIRLSNYAPPSKSLYDTIAHLDSVFFNAFNTRNFDELKSLISENLEFYHDLGGVTNYDQNINAFKKTFESDRRVRRELVAGTLEVYPIQDYGAVETGTHRFYARENGQKEKLSSVAKFVQLWQQKDGKWKIARIISYGHQEFLK
ncbi:MAG TPA: nuclear transport factor 2 family protein [Flavisolibacter sp.]|nr:nuclear transport factor 2 family protein [Flavisolibacter sp.]